VWCLGFSIKSVMIEISVAWFNGFCSINVNVVDPMRHHSVWICDVWILKGKWIVIINIYTRKQAHTYLGQYISKTILTGHLVMSSSHSKAPTDAGVRQNLQHTLTCIEWTGLVQNSVNVTYQKDRQREHRTINRSKMSYYWAVERKKSNTLDIFERWR